jgi:hypothetical protein
MRERAWLFLFFLPRISFRILSQEEVKIMNMAIGALYIVFGMSVSSADTGKSEPVVSKISENEASDIAKKCLVSLKEPVQANEALSLETRTQSNGKAYWLVRVAKIPALPEGARFINIYDKSHLTYFGHHFTKKLKYKNGSCK